MSEPAALVMTILAIVAASSPALAQGTVTLYPGNDLQAAASAHPPFTTFLLTGGTYRLPEVSPKEGQQFIGELGPNGERLAILNGARVLTEWVAWNGFWYVTGQTQQQVLNGECEDPACEYAEELFIDGQRRAHVLTLSDLAPGRWYFDYDADRIFIAEDPVGRFIETSVADRALAGPANGVVVRNLVVEKYANQATQAAIDSRAHNSAPPSTGADWLVENNEVRWNHGTGIRVTDRGLVQGNYVHHNGQLGVKAAGTGAAYINNEIAFNHFAGFVHAWEAGGSKFAGTTDLFVAYNYVHHNNGSGLWSDVSSLRTTYLGNRVEYNGRVGIFYEISYTARIEANLVVGNGFDHSGWACGAGIAVAGSPDVDVIGNIVIDNADGVAGIQQDRGDGDYGPHIVENLWVADNCIQQQEGWTGIVQDTGSNLPFCCRNNHFAYNTYSLPDPEGPYLTWDFHRMGITEWRTYHPSDGLLGTCNPAHFRELVYYEDFATGDLQGWTQVVGGE
jgi:hypothetical protein